MNSTYSITSKFQVTIPKDAREKLGISSNDRVKFTTKNSRLFIERVPSMQEVANYLAADLKSRGIRSATDEDIKNARHTFYSKDLKWEEQ
jgi:AbrB family looped-hinge helix DNA binding protein